MPSDSVVRLTARPADRTGQTLEARRRRRVAAWDGHRAFGLHKHGASFMVTTDRLNAME